MVNKETGTLKDYVDNYLLHIELNETVVIKKTGEEKTVLEIESIGDDLIVYMYDNTSYHINQVIKKSMINVIDILSKEWGKVSDDIFDTLDLSEPKTTNISKKRYIYCLDNIRNLWTRLKRLII